MVSNNDLALFTPSDYAYGVTREERTGILKEKLFCVWSFGMNSCP